MRVVPIVRRGGVPLALALLAACESAEPPGPPRTTTVPEPVVSLNAGAPGYVLGPYHLYAPDGQPVPGPAAERGRRLTAAWVDAGGEIWLGYDRGAIHRSPDGGATWIPEVEGFRVPDVGVIDLALRRPIPRRFVRAADGTLWLATLGRGVMRYDADLGAWVDGTFSLAEEGGFHPLAWTVAAHGDGVLAGFASARGTVPPEYEPMFGELARTLSGPDAEVALLPLDPAVRFVTGAGERHGRPVIATLGQGVLEHDGAAWVPLGPDPAPADLGALSVSASGALAASTLSGDVWVRRVGAWTRIRCGGIGREVADVRWAGDRVLVAAGATVEDLPATAVTCPARGGATVYLAFSQHVNLYHSYRGDTATDDGYGKDLRILRSTLEIFDAHPTFHNDWDVENLFSLDGWLASDGADIREGLARRVEAGQDGLRLMSWNNGHVALETGDELAASITRAQDSLEAFTPGLWAPGVQPQENSYTPAHPARYRALGVDWITLFNSATSFTGFRHEAPLPLDLAHAVLTLGSDLGPETLTLVPVYHHGDVMEHGGLASWLRQLHENLTGAAVLAVHFDADSETWTAYGSELADVESMDADWVRPARLQDVVAELAPAGEVVLRRDLADGAFDGFASWTDKPVNHRFYTRVARSRLLERWARALAAPLPASAEAALAAAFEARLRTLSTTHFGLAVPALHPEREAAGEAVSVTADASALAALEAVLADATPLAAPAALNPAAAAVTFVQPADGGWADASGAGAVRPVASADGARIWLVGTLDAGAAVPLVAEAPTPTPEPWGVVGWQPAGLDLTLAGPRLRFDGEDFPAEPGAATLATQPGAEVLTITGAWTRGEGGSVRYDFLRLDVDSSAWWVEVEVTFPAFDKITGAGWEEAVPLELVMPTADATWTVTRPLVSGEAASYAVSEPLDALNTHAADGWLWVGGAGGASLAVSTYVPLRAAPAFLPLRLVRTDAGDLELRLAPFGALWGDLPDHRAGMTLGTGLAEAASRMTAPQLKPSAPAWSGARAWFLLRIAPGADPGSRADREGARDGVLVIDDARRVVLPAR